MHGVGSQCDKPNLLMQVITELQRTHASSAYLSSSAQVSDSQWLLHYYSCTTLHLSASTANHMLYEKPDLPARRPERLDLKVLDTEVEKDL